MTIISINSCNNAAISFTLNHRLTPRYEHFLDKSATVPVPNRTYTEWQDNNNMEKTYVPLGDYFCSDCINCKLTRLWWCCRAIQRLCSDLIGRCRHFSHYRLYLERESVDYGHQVNSKKRRIFPSFFVLNFSNFGKKFRKRDDIIISPS